ncbi:MAG: hypothetical protein ACK5QC_07340 [Bacteroidota bacterium]
MKASYSLLFSVTISHNYFENSLIPYLVIEPGATTKKTLANYNLAFKQTDTGFNVFYDTLIYNTSQSFGFLLQKLTFVFSTSEANFFNYTDISNFNKNTCLYFSNANHGSSKKTSAPTLSANQFVTEKDVFQLIPSTLNSPISKDNSVTVTNTSHTIIKPNTVTATNAIYTNLNGIYVISNAKEKTKYLADTSLFKSKPMAVIDLFLNEQTVSEAYQIFNENKITPKNFLLHFNSNFVKWRYYIVNKTNTKVNNLFIESSNNKIMFVKEGNTKILNCLTYVLISSSEIKMQHYPLTVLSLIIDGDSGKKEYKNIMVPSAETMQLEKETTYLNAYIYI